jgi:hypothetical protein
MELRNNHWTKSASRAFPDYFPSTASIAAKPLLSGVRHLNLGAISRVDELPLFFDSA